MALVLTTGYRYINSDCGGDGEDRNILVKMVAGLGHIWLCWR